MHSFFGLLVSTVAVLGYGTWDARGSGIPIKRWHQFVFGALLAGLVAGRIGFILVNFGAYAAEPWRVLEVWRGGSVYLASFLGWLTFFFAFTAKSRVSRWAVADVTTRCIALSYGIHSLGDGLFALNERTADLYRGIACLGIFFVLLWLRKHARFDGQSVLVFVVLYCLTRIATEPLDGTGAIIGGVIYTRQIVAFVFMLVAGSVLVIKHRGQRSPTASAV